ncbi:uncharacterized protein A4U43_C05F20640 [Asparagus officinalis]|uniref:Uncharacterized protein n=1 Tax=Asparagus officinalis TaxID=4686 RepID=A0A5P1ET56_ASPOF|nr:uncharacterized protein LOC109840082 [Asparagus officinalis]ONK69225.1 uncharacterized protein A4U43_C05F20640 [Asparagus officinalis]
MAAAEARAAWRTANRCWVQEDAKRAPKLACCPSSSSAQQYDSCNGNVANGQEQPTHNFMPLNWNPMNSNLPPDTRWWLQLQTSFGCQKDFTTELNVLEDELEEKGYEHVVPTSTLSDKRLDHNNDDYPSESPGMVSTAFMKKDSKTRVDEMKTVSNISQQPLERKVDSEDYLFQDWEFMDWKPVDRLIPKKTEGFGKDLDSPWAGHKCEPWWRISDQDELASLVAQKSLEQIENCDLPKPTQTVHVSGDPFACLESLDGNRIFSSSVGYKLNSSSSYPNDYPQHSSITGSSDGKCQSSDGSHFPSDSEKLYSGNQSFAPSANDIPENSQTSDTNSSRAELLEALRHSQTRAREAEIAAQKAYSEKEHIFKLFFKQASHLFAYKQWLRMLQLESLCLQLRIKEHQISTLFPVLPFMPHKGDGTKSKRKKHKNCSFCKYAVAFAVGLGLAGAGLLLGWSLGWLLPHL